jgi:hypothetical protein
MLIYKTKKNQGYYCDLEVTNLFSRPVLLNIPAGKQLHMCFKVYAVIIKSFGFRR